MTEALSEGVPLRFGHLGDTHFIHRAEMRTITPQPGSGVDAILEIAVTEENVNGAGGLQGGMVATLIDCAGGSAMRRHVDAVGGFATQDLAIHYVAAMRHGPARAIARMRKVGARTAVVQVDVVDMGDGERLCALGTLTFAVFGERRTP